MCAPVVVSSSAIAGEPSAAGAAQDASQPPSQAERQPHALRRGDLRSNASRESRSKLLGHRPARRAALDTGARFMAITSFFTTGGEVFSSNG
jgi:hypothetical protein